MASHRYPCPPNTLDAAAEQKGQQISDYHDDIINIMSSGDRPMNYSPTARVLSDAIEASGLTHTEIAHRIGFKQPSVITMLRQGLTRVPLPSIPALAQTLGMDQSAFLLLAIEEYHSGVYEILTEVLGLPFSDAEQGLVVLFRMSNLKADIELEGPLKRAIESVLELAEAGKG